MCWAWASATAAQALRPSPANLNSAICANSAGDLLSWAPCHAAAESLRIRRLPTSHQATRISHRCAWRACPCIDSPSSALSSVDRGPRDGLQLIQALGIFGARVIVLLLRLIKRALGI